MSNLTQKAKRDTRQRDAIRKAFESSGRPLSPKELLELASKWVPHIGIATIYRNIKSMVADKELDVIPIPTGMARYYLPGRAYKAIFVCEDTDRAYFLDDAAITIHMPQHLEGLEIKSSSLFFRGTSSKR